MEATAGEIYDSVMMVNVLEHIEDDHAAARGLFAAMRPGGSLLILSRPCRFCTANWIGDMATFAVTGNEIAQLHRKRRLPDKKLRYFDIVGVFPWWLLNTIMGKTSFHQSSLRLRQNFRAADQAARIGFAPPLGKNLILIASKD